jgi:hypothetical protein
MPGLFFMRGMGLQFPPGAIVLSVDESGHPKMEIRENLLRLDLWPTWLEIGCIHTDQARKAAARLRPDLPGDEKGVAVAAELQAGLVAVTAFAFAVDGFYDTIRNELGPHPDQGTWRTGIPTTPRHKQVSETLRYHLKFGPDFTRQNATIIKELFGFRDRAVHPSGKFVAPNYRPEIDSGVHPHLITFSGPHATQCRAVVLTLLDRYVSQAEKLARPGADRGWLDSGREVLDRLIVTYRVPGDDQLAFPLPTGDQASEESDS